MKLPGNLQQMMQQAQRMQEALQQEIAKIKVDVSVGGGMVSVHMDGRKNLLAINIDPEVAGDVGALQDLILSAMREAARQVDEEAQKTMKDKMGGLGLPPGLF